MLAAARERAGLWIQRAIRPGRDWSSLPRGTGAVLAFSPPGFLGVTESTRRFFPSWHPLEARDLVTRRDRTRFVEGLVAASPGRVVFSGFDRGYGSVLELLRKRLPSLPIFVLWHASPMQLAEGCNRAHFETIVDLGRRGVITRVGCFKAGLSATLERVGVDGRTVFNPPPRFPRRDGRRSTGSSADATRLGIFLAGTTWRKNPYAMLDAAARLGTVELTGVLDPGARRFAEALGLGTIGVASFPLGRDALERAAASQDCNLYVGLSECSPLFPLESLHLGVPCLVGPSSHLFIRSPILDPGKGASDSSARPADLMASAEAAAFLESILVVARPEDPDAIAEAVRGAIEHRTEILEAYGVWELAYRPAAEASMEALIEAPLPRFDSP